MPSIENEPQSVGRLLLAAPCQSAWDLLHSFTICIHTNRHKAPGFSLTTRALHHQNFNGVSTLVESQEFAGQWFSEHVWEPFSKPNALARTSGKCVHPMNVTYRHADQPTPPLLICKPKSRGPSPPGVVIWPIIFANHRHLNVNLLRGQRNPGNKLKMVLLWINAPDLAMTNSSALNPLRAELAPFDCILFENATSRNRSVSPAIDRRYSQSS